MERVDFLKHFANRLNLTLQKRGYSSSRSKSKVEVAQLAEVAGVSYQMARKYVLGLALPDYHVVPKISKWLGVSSSWLLFGERESLLDHKAISLIEIERELLSYILHKSIILFPPVKNIDKIINYIVGMIYDASHINADINTIFKIIDMMLSSASEFSEISKKRA